MNKEITILNFLTILSLVTIIFVLIINIINLHPVTIILSLLIYRLLICFNLSLWKSNFIYSIILFLIIIRGLLIIFLYFSSLISNEQNNFKLNKFLLLRMSLNILFLLILIKKILFNFNKKYIYNEIILFLKFNEISFQNILNLYEYPFNNITIISMLYLLISLFTIIKICSIKSTTIRKIN